MLPDRVSNPGPLTYESGALPIALRGPASCYACRDLVALLPRLRPNLSGLQRRFYYVLTAKGLQLRFINAYDDEIFLRPKSSAA